MKVFLKSTLFIAVLCVSVVSNLFSETPAGTVIYNGGDTGNTGIPDQPGDTIVSRVLPSGNTLYYTCTPVSITVVASSGIFVNNNTGKTINIDNKIKIFFDAFDVGQNVYLFYSRDPLTSPILINPSIIQEANSKIDLNPKMNYISDSICEIALQDIHGNWLSGSDFNSPVKIELYYNDTNNNGFVDGTSPPVYEDSLRIFTLNETLKQWDELKDSKTDTIDNFVETNINHFSVFILIGKKSAVNLDRVIVYPNPYKPGSGTKYDRPEGIVFDILTEDVKIRIFNIAGELVFEHKTQNSRGRYEWKAINNSGNKLASGIYIYIITNENGDVKKGKLAIIK